MGKAKKWILWTLVILLGASLMAGWAAGNSLYALALTPGSDQTALLEAAYGRASAQGSHKNDPLFTQWEAWYRQLDVREVANQSFDRLTLYADQVLPPQAGHRWVILCHDEGGSGPHMLLYAKRFYEWGFGLLLPDARGLGRSEGETLGLGWYDRLDLVGWIHQVLAQDPEAEIVLFGLSMGAATVMMAAGEALPPNVKAIIEEGGYTSVWDELAHQQRLMLDVPPLPTLLFASVVTKMRAGWTLGEASALAQVQKSTLPILFIHGEEDALVPPWMMQQLYEAAGPGREKLLVPDAGHGLAARVGGADYWEAVAAFLERNTGFVLPRNATEEIFGEKEAEAGA